MGPQETFLRKYAAAAVAAGQRFHLNPVVILAQAAHESGWGTSYSAQHRHNLFGMLATQATSEFWHGERDQSKKPPYLVFRIYRSDIDSLSDFARLIATSPKYAAAHSVSFNPSQYAKAIAASPYISEANGDNRAQYAQAVASNSASLSRLATQIKLKLT